MPKHLKLKISDLRVQSFVTSLGEKKEALIKGGASASTCQACTDHSACDTCSPTECGATCGSCGGTCDTCVTCGGTCGGTCGTCVTCVMCSATCNPKVQTCAAVPACG